MSPADTTYPPGGTSRIVNDEPFVRLERLARQRLGWNNWLRIEALQLMADALMNGWLVRRDFSRGESLLQQAAKLDPNEYR